MYDAKYKAKFGAKAKSRLDKIVAHTKTFFAHKSLTIPIFIKNLKPYFADKNSYLANADQGEK